MANDKPKRRHWLIDTAKNVLSTVGITFKLDKMTEGAIHFLMLYGLKQYLADCLAVQKPVVLTTAEIKERLDKRFANLCSDKFELITTESGYYWKDPNAVAAIRGESASLETIYTGLVNDGNSPEDAIAKVLLWTGKTYTPK